jgi:hypothetical protein
LAEIGIPTYVGSSGKIFPEKGIKPVEVLAALKNNLLENGATFHFQQELIDFNASELIFKNANETINVSYLHAIFALGGGSWKKTGSDGNWQHLFEQKGIEIIPFQSSNAGMICEHWNPQLEGTIIKNCLVQFGGSSKKGEVRFTKYGLEGAPIYALNHAFRNGAITLEINLKPSLSDDKIKCVLTVKGQNRSQQLETLKLPKGVIQYLKSICSKEDYLDDEKIFNVIKNLPFKIKELRPVDEAISTVGGISMNSITNDFRLKNHPTCYCVGEMLDWDAPTGGYLLQACFSSGFVAGNSIAKG